MNKALVPICSAPETGCECSLCDLSTWQMEAGGSSVGGHPWLHSDPKANLGYMRPCLNSKQNKKIERKNRKGNMKLLSYGDDQSFIPQTTQGALRSWGGGGVPWKLQGSGTGKPAFLLLIPHPASEDKYQLPVCKKRKVMLWPHKERRLV